MSATDSPILVVVVDPVLHPEAIHVATVTGRTVIDTVDPEEIARYAPRAHAVLADADGSAQFRTGTRHPRLFLVAPDPGPVDWRAAMTCHAESAFLLPAQSPELLAAFGQGDVTPSGGRVLGVLGAVGGSGASTLAAAVARVLVDDTPILVDAVNGSGGLDLLLCLEDAPGARWPELAFDRGHVELTDLMKALPRTPDGVTVLSTTRSRIRDPFVLETGRLMAVLDCIRAGAGTAIVDLPSGHAGARWAVTLCDLVVLVVPAEVRAVAAAAALTAELAGHRTPCFTVLRHRSWSGIDATEMERLTSTDCLAELGQVANLPKSCELHGLPARLPRVLASTARAIAAELGELP
ncbi:septum site determining protein [Corynebacterium sp. CCM 9185]|uniref:Septum site determining protein n=1 Tax=Corynebacterium marambiense TaxID=2765364 RepID=A0ABS0VTD6_9CORY|nr:septum site-determining protein Ssd [Corynebacterium marambiense]MBI8999616.1 septum site determining protein [Corynebacterium marambiense]MCK7662454.1 septum site determining protein [Corynebacterium marambiense]MCX7541741.1 septum site determining protein [Corynebacterium marambiense]